MCNTLRFIHGLCFIFFAIEHDVYYYSFGSNQAFRRQHTYHKKASTNVSFRKKELDRPMQAAFGVWTRSETFEYELVHKMEDQHPHCTYVLLHRVTEPASKAKLNLFVDASGERLWKYTSIESLLPINKPIPQQYKILSEKFHEAINLYSTIVPAALVSKVTEDLNIQFNQLESKLLAIENGEVEAVTSLNNFHKDGLKLMVRLAQIQREYQKDVNKETQRNDFCYSHLKPVLNQLGFTTKQTLEQSDVCIFGKSVMDFCFYQQNSGIVRSAVISQPDDNESVVGGVAEFKCDDVDLTAHYAQMFANLVRVGTQLAYDCLIMGKIIDKILVYGLLTNYNTGLAHVMKYDVNFSTDESHFFVGGEMDAIKGLVGIVQAMNDDVET